MFKHNHFLVRRRSRLILEELEARTLLSASIPNSIVSSPQAVLSLPAQASLSATPQAHSGGSGVTNPTPFGYSPSQIQNAYGFNKISFNNGAIKGDGSGQTIAIVDAYNDPNIKSDLNAFDAKFGLPAANLTVVNQNGGANLPQTNPGWALETALDVEWAHAMAPGANLLLVEATNSSLSNLLTAVNYAGQNASVVSMSWGTGEFSSETSYDSYFNKPGVTFVAASGDSGAGSTWPAVSPNVVAVGGTTLTMTNSGGYISETGWSGSGGGYSAYENEPAYQSGVQSSGVRTSPDIAYNANPYTGYAVYDTVSNSGQTGWFQVGGTSAGAPQVAAMVAIANQGRALAGESYLSGASQTLPALYNMSSNNFHDITSGSNGYSAGLGYNLVTGRGSPLANSVVQALVSATSNGHVNNSAANSGSSTPSNTAKKADVVAGDPPQTSSGLTSVSLGTLQTLVISEPAILFQPVQINTTTIFPFGTASVLSSAFGAGPNLAALNVNNPTQAASAFAAAQGLQFYAPGPKSVSNPETLGNYLSPFAPYTPDAVPLTGADESDELGADGPFVPRRTIRISSFLGEIDLEQAPQLPVKQQGEEASIFEATLVDDASMAFLAEESLAEASSANELLLRLRVPSLALLGVLASSFWMVPDTAEENRKRRVILV